MEKCTEKKLFSDLFEIFFRHLLASVSLKIYKHCVCVFVLNYRPLHKNTLTQQEQDATTCQHISLQLHTRIHPGTRFQRWSL